MGISKVITIPSPDFELNEFVSYQHTKQSIKSRLYDLDNSQWLYRFDNRATYVTKDEITATGVSWK